MSIYTVVNLFIRLVISAIIATSINVSTDSGAKFGLERVTF